MPQLIDTPGAAELLGVRPQTLAAWRVRGQGPRYRKVGALVRYDVRDVESWLEAQTRTSTSDPGADAA